MSAGSFDRKEEQHADLVGDLELAADLPAPRLPHRFAPNIAEIFCSLPRDASI